MFDIHWLIRVSQYAKYAIVKVEVTEHNDN